MRVIGLGLSSKATAVEVGKALTAAGHVDGLAVLDSRAHHPALSGLPFTMIPITDAAIHGIETPTRSARIKVRYGCGSVAEALALVASRGEIVVPRQIIGHVTWAVAELNPMLARKDRTP